MKCNKETRPLKCQFEFFWFCQHHSNFCSEIKLINLFDMSSFRSDNQENY